MFTSSAAATKFLTTMLVLMLATTPMLVTAQCTEACYEACEAAYSTCRSDGFAGCAPNYSICLSECGCPIN